MDPLGHGMERQQGALPRPVRIVAFRTPLDAHGKVFIKEGALLVCMALVTHFLLESAELAPDRGAMLVMAIHSAHHFLEHAMPLVQKRRRQFLLVATGANRRNLFWQELVVGGVHMGRMARFAGYAAL